MTIIDQNSDPAFGNLYHFLGAHPGLEDVVKTAEMEVTAIDSLPESSFAWPDERKFPIHTREHTALSYAYSKMAEELPAAVVSALETAREVYDIPIELYTATKVAQAEPEYLLPDWKLFPIRTPDDVKTAESKLLEGVTKLTVDLRAAAFTNLHRQADLHKVALTKESAVYAGRTVSRTQGVIDWLEARGTACTDERTKKAYDRLAGGLRKQPHEMRNRDELVTLAATIHDLDKKAGFERHYDRKIPDPLKTVFNTSKLASETMDIAGTNFPLSKLAALPASFWRDLGGDELEREIAPGGRVDVSKIAAIVDTLPLDLKIILKSQLR